MQLRTYLHNLLVSTIFTEGLDADMDLGRWDSGPSGSKAQASTPSPRSSPWTAPPHPVPPERDPRPQHRRRLRLATFASLGMPTPAPGWVLRQGDLNRGLWDRWRPATHRLLPEAPYGRQSWWFVSEIAAGRVGRLLDGHAVVFSRVGLATVVGGELRWSLAG